MRAPSVAGQLWDKTSRHSWTSRSYAASTGSTPFVAGLSANRYQLEEILESEVKTRSQDLGTIFTNKYVTDPEFRELFDKVLQERAGTPFEGLRTLSPASDR